MWETLERWAMLKRELSMKDGMTINLKSWLECGITKESTKWNDYRWKFKEAIIHSKLLQIYHEQHLKLNRVQKKKKTFEA